MVSPPEEFDDTLSSSVAPEPSDSANGDPEIETGSKIPAPSGSPTSVDSEHPAVFASTPEKTNSILRTRPGRQRTRSRVSWSPTNVKSPRRHSSRHEFHFPSGWRNSAEGI